MNIDDIIGKVADGGRVSADEALALYLHAPTHVLGRLADGIRLRKHPDRTVTYIIDRNVNYTNVCVAKCNFCAFYRDVGIERRLRARASRRSSGRSTRRSRSAACSCSCRAATIPICRSTWYEDLFRAIKERYPDFKLHALSPPEVIHLSRLSQLSVPRGHRSADRRGPRQHSRRRRRDSRRSRSPAAALLRQGDRRRMARRHASRASAAASEPRRR